MEQSLTLSCQLFYRLKEVINMFMGRIMPYINHLEYTQKICFVSLFFYFFHLLLIYSYVCKEYTLTATLLGAPAQLLLNLSI